ncbi:MAG: methylmalonyl-CoA mutase family protein [Acidimicrobiales bacterium]
MEVAKLRAARLLWHELMQEFELKDPKSLMLRTHCQTPRLAYRTRPV